MICWLSDLRVELKVDEHFRIALRLLKLVELVLEGAMWCVWLLVIVLLLFVEIVCSCEILVLILIGKLVVPSVVTSGCPTADPEYPSLKEPY